MTSPSVYKMRRLWEKAGRRTIRYDRQINATSYSHLFRIRSGNRLLDLSSGIRDRIQQSYQYLYYPLRVQQATRVQQAVAYGSSSAAYRSILVTCLNHIGRLISDQLLARIR